MDVDDPIAGRYRPLRQIGSGAMGQVWRCHDVVLQRDVAIKIVDLANAPESIAGERFRREAFATAQISNPNVVSVFDAGQDDKRAYLVMQLLEGPDLRQMLKSRGRLDWDEGLALLQQVASGLAAAHSINIIHRDIKPANVVLHHASPRIVDFGIARLFQTPDQTLTAAGAAIGTAAYMSPEQALANKSVGPSSDMYSFGCLMVAVLTGRPPFQGDSDLAIANAHILQPPPRMSDLRGDTPPAINTLVERLLSKDPEQRPTAVETQNEIARVISDRTVSSGPLPLSIPDPSTRSFEQSLEVARPFGVDDDYQSDQESRTTPVGTDIDPQRYQPGPRLPHDGAPIPPAELSGDQDGPSEFVFGQRAGSLGLGDPAVNEVVTHRSAIATTPLLPSPEPSVPDRQLVPAVTAGQPVRMVSTGWRLGRFARKLYEARVIPVVLAMALIAGMIVYLTYTPPTIRPDQTIRVGPLPYTPAVGPDGSVYVSNSYDGTVSVIKGDRVTTTLAVGKSPWSPAVGPDGTVYVSNDGDGTVSVIKGDRVTTTIPVGESPWTPAVGPDGTVYVSNSGDATMSVIKGARVTTTIPVGKSPGTPAVGPDGTVYIPNLDGGAVSVIKGDRVTATIPVSQGPLTPAAGPDGTVYVSNHWDKSVSMIKGDSVTTTIPVGESPWEPAVGPDGTVYVSNSGDATVSVINSGRVTTTIRVGKFPDRPAIGPDGSVYVPNDGKVSVIKGDRVTATILVGRSPQTPAVGSDGTVYISDYGSDGTVSILR